MKKFIISAITALILTTSNAWQANASSTDPFIHERLTRSVTFGDSLSDTGNLFLVSGFPPAMIIDLATGIQSDGYFQGRFANGPVWIEHFIESLELDNFDPESLNVLVVDDSSMARKQIIRTLERMGIEKFAVACDGKEAIPLIDNEYFDLVITDYNMPEVDGEALIEYIRNESKQPTVPILMVTSEGDMNRLAAVEQSGVSAICDKPFEPQTVKSMIEAIMAV